MPLIKVIITAIYYLIVLFLMNPLTDIMGIKDGLFQFILTESIILIAVIILNRRYVKQPIHWLPVNIMSILRKNSLPLSLAIIFLLIFFRNHMYQFLISLLLSLIVAITEEYAFRGMIFRTLLALNLKKFATLQATIASMMTASLILRLCIWSTFYHSPYGQYCVKFSMLLG